MRRAKGGLVLFFFLFLLGVAHLLRYSEKVRFVDFLGISGSGAQIGVALVGMVGCCLVLTGRLRLADNKPAEVQTAVAETNRGNLING